MKPVLVALLGLLALPAILSARQQTACEVQDKHREAEQKVVAAENSLDALLDNLKKSRGTRLSGDLKAQLAAAQAEVAAKAQALPQEELRLQEAEREMQTFVTAATGQRIATLEAQIKAKNDRLKELAAKLNPNLDRDIAAKKTEVATAEDKLRGLGLPLELAAGLTFVTDAGTAAGNAIAGLPARLAAMTGLHDAPLNSLPTLKLSCTTFTSAVATIQDDIRNLADKKSQNTGVRDADKAIDAEVARITQKLTALANEIPACQGSLRVFINDLATKRADLEKLEGDPVKAEIVKLTKEKASLESELAPLKVQQTTVDTKLAEARRAVTLTQAGQRAAEGLMREIQANLILADAVQVRDALAKEAADAENRKNEAIKVAQEVMKSADARTTPAAKENLRGQLEAKIRQRSDYTQEELDLQKLSGPAAKTAEVEFKKRWRNRLNNATDRAFANLRDSEVSRLRATERTLNEFDPCWPDAVAMRDKVAARAIDVQSRVAVVAGQDFDYYNDDGWEKWAIAGAAVDDELPDDITKYTTEEKIFFVRPGQWLSTGIMLKQGESFGITATGTVKADASWLNREWGPGGFYFIGFMAYTLKGLVDGKLIEIGSGGGGTAPVDGELQLGITKTYEKIYPTDARFTGGFKVTVGVRKPAP